MAVGVVDGLPLVGSGVAVDVGVGLPVGCTVLVLLVVLGPVKCIKFNTYTWVAILERSKRPTVDVVH